MIKLRPETFVYVWCFVAVADIVKATHQKKQHAAEGQPSCGYGSSDSLKNTELKTCEQFLTHDMLLQTSQMYVTKKK